MDIAVTYQPVREQVTPAGSRSAGKSRPRRSVRYHGGGGTVLAPAGKQPVVFDVLSALRSACGLAAACRRAQRCHTLHRHRFRPHRGAALPVAIWSCTKRRAQADPVPRLKALELQPRSVAPRHSPGARGGCHPRHLRSVQDRRGSRRIMQSAAELGWRRQSIRPAGASGIG